MEVDNAIEMTETIFILLDRQHPWLDGTQIVSKVKLSSRLNAAESSHRPTGSPADATTHGGS